MDNIHIIVVTVILCGLICAVASQYPGGYNNDDCGTCPPGYIRTASYGPYCGQCVPERPSIDQGGLYMDGGQCPCPGSDYPHRSTGCRQDESGRVSCFCEKNYVGAKCDTCAPGYIQRDYYPYDCYEPGKTSGTCQGSMCSQGVCPQKDCGRSNCCQSSHCESGFHCRQPLPQQCPNCDCRGPSCGCDTCNTIDKHYHHHHEPKFFVQNCTIDVPKLPCRNCTTPPITTCEKVEVHNNVTNLNYTHVVNHNKNIYNVSTVVNTFNYSVSYLGEECTECLCDPRGTLRQVGNQCVCKKNVVGASCSQCKDGFFGLSKDDEDGCQCCFCSGLTVADGCNNCREKLFSADYIRLSAEKMLQYIQLTNRNGSMFQPTGLSNTEIRYRFGSTAADDLYWHLPRAFTGQRTTSYGGKLRIQRRITTALGSQTSSSPSTQIIIAYTYGSAIYFVGSQTFPGGVIGVLEVRLDEKQGWMYQRDSISRPASRNDIMEVLVDVQKILIRASFVLENPSDRILETTLGEFSMPTVTGELHDPVHGFISIEECMCPPGYQGLSCESCSPGYYRDYTDLSKGLFGLCKRCPCGENSKGCYLVNGKIVCNCKDGFSFDGRKCSNCESIALRMDPFKCQDCWDSLVTFNCSYAASASMCEPDLALELSTIPSWSSLSTYPGATRSGVTFPGTSGGSCNSIFGTLPLLKNLQKVMCTLKNKKTGEVIAEVKSSVDGMDFNKPVTSNGFFNTSGEFACINTTQTATFSCYAGLTAVIWYKEADMTRPLSYDPIIQFGGRWSNPRALPADPSYSGTYVCIAYERTHIFSKRFEILITDSYKDSCSDVIKPGDDKPGLGFGSGPGFSGGNSYSSYRRPPRQTNGERQAEKGDDSDGYMKDAPAEEAAETGVNEELSSVSSHVYIYPTVQRVLVGQPAQFKCTATGESVTVLWEAANGQFETRKQPEDGVLSFESVKREDEGNYICIGYNAEGKSAAKASLVVVDPEQFDLTASLDPSAHQVRPGDSVTLTCESNVRTMEMKWRRDGAELPLSSMQNEDGSLLIDNVQLSDAGLYICEAASESGEVATAKVQLTITQEEDTASMTPPTVKIRPYSPFRVPIGQNIRIHCHAHGNPQPIVRWSRYDANSGSERTLLEVSAPKAEYELTAVTKDDAGNYTCTAINKAGEAREVLTIIVGPNCGCSDDEFSCKNGGGCVSAVNICDGYPNCRDGSDESNCVRHQRTRSV